MWRYYRRIQQSNVTLDTVSNTPLDSTTGREYHPPTLGTLGAHEGHVKRYREKILLRDQLWINNPLKLDNHFIYKIKLKNIIHFIFALLLWHRAYDSVNRKLKLYIKLLQDYGFYGRACQYYPVLLAKSQINKININNLKKIHQN